MYIVLAIIAFGILIAVHEGGHFLAAKAFGVKVNEFAIGMGPVLLKKQGKETLYSLRLLPLVAVNTAGVAILIAIRFAHNRFLLYYNGSIIS